MCSLLIPGLLCVILFCARNYNTLADIYDSNMHVSVSTTLFPLIFSIQPHKKPRGFVREPTRHLCLEHQDARAHVRGLKNETGFRDLKWGGGKKCTRTQILRTVPVPSISWTPERHKSLLHTEREQYQSCNSNTEERGMEKVRGGVGERERETKSYVCYEMIKLRNISRRMYCHDSRIDLSNRIRRRG